MYSDTLSELIANATGVEALAAIVGVAGIAYSLYSLIDDVYDMRAVAAEGEVGGPRWITARGHLLFSVAMLAGWFGYAHVAIIAAYLPPRPDMPDSTIVGQVAAMRLVYAVLMLLGQLTLRWTRLQLRGMPRSQWAALFGDADRWRLKFLEEHAALAREKSHNHELGAQIESLRAERHDREQRITAAQVEVQLIRRQAAQQGVALTVPTTIQE